MSGKEIFGALSLILAAIGYSVYIHSIFRGRTKPHMFSWIIWGTVSGIASLAQLAEQGGAGAWAAGASALVCYVLAILGFLRGEKNITRSDWVFFIGALMALPLWYVTKEPLWSVILVVVIDTLGFFPTIRKSYSKPYEESALMYGIDAGKFIFSLLALENYSMTAILYPVVATCLNSLFVVMLLWRRQSSP